MVYYMKPQLFEMMMVAEGLLWESWVNRKSPGCLLLDTDSFLFARIGIKMLESKVGTETYPKFEPHVFTLNLNKACFRMSGISAYRYILEHLWGGAKVYRAFAITLVLFVPFTWCVTAACQRPNVITYFLFAFIKGFTCIKCCNESVQWIELLKTLPSGFLF